MTTYYRRSGYQHDAEMAYLRYVSRKRREAAAAKKAAEKKKDGDDG